MVLRRSATEKLRGFPAAPTIATGIALIAGGLLWPQVPALHGSMSPTGVDFIQGFLVGIGIACEVMGLGSLLAGRRKNDGDPA